MPKPPPLRLGSRSVRSIPSQLAVSSFNLGAGGNFQRLNIPSFRVGVSQIGGNCPIGGAKILICSGAIEEGVLS